MFLVLALMLKLSLHVVNLVDDRYITYPCENDYRGMKCYNNICLHYEQMYCIKNIIQGNNVTGLDVYIYNHDIIGSKSK